MNDYIDVEKIYEIIYNIIKDEDTTFIPIGESIGSWFALHFSNLYSSKCLKTIFLEGAYVVGNEELFLDGYTKIQTKKLTNKNISFLVDKLLSNKEENRYEFNTNVLTDYKKLINITFNYYYEIIKKELNGKLKVPTISFVDLNYDLESENHNNKWNIIRINHEEKLYNINGNNIITHYLINSTHHPWYLQRYSDRIINTINNIL